MCIRTSYRHTVAAAYIGYVTQAIINNFAPLLFLTFSTTWDIPLTRVALLVAVNFGVQITVDLLSAPLVDRIGYRPCIVVAHLLAAAGLVGLGVFPRLFASPFVGVVVAVVLYAVGGGLTEVLISSIVEACPTEHKEAEMSLLHSFYCWGHVFVILASTLFFTLCGIENWAILACLWAIVPLFNAVYFSLVPIRHLCEGEGEGSMPLFRLLRTGTFWLFVAIMFCAGAAEQAMSQWASAFAEAGLHVSKTVGDLAGPCMFAVLMGTARLVSARLERFIRMEVLIGICCGLCLVSYLLAALSPWDFLSLVGCGLCGLSVGIMWPGTISTASSTCPRGGTALFAFLALAGDIGCIGGPSVVGLATDHIAGGSLKGGMLVGGAFPVLLVLGLVIHARAKKR